MATQEPSPPSSMESNKPGFPKKILGNKLEDKHLCNCCHNILRRPFQAQCGHRFCSYCFNRTVSNGPQKCNACIKEDIFEEPDAFPDNAVRREVEHLSAVCINENCTWKGSIKDYELNHEGKCEFMIIPCPSCKERIRFNEQERHNERECPERTLNCKYCKEPFHFKNIKYPMICEGCAKKKIPREKYVDHIKFCSKFRTPCRFHVVGCDMSVEKEKIHDHERAYAYEHLNLLLHYIMGMKVSMEGLQPQGLELAGHKLVELQQSLRELEARVSQLSTTSSGPPVQGAAAAAIASSSSSSSGPPASAPLPPPPTLAPTLSVSTSFTPLPSSVGAALELQLHSEKTKVAELGRRCTELEVKSGTFENVVCVLNREVERFATTMEASNRQHKLDQDKIEALSNKVRQLERTVGLKDLTVAEMEGRLREMSATTFDGVFVWRISDFAKKRQDAIAGRAPAMFSPAFYTSKYGYKMCLRIYLNGDGTGRGSHLSLFFVVMRGLSDALLKWPFNQKVTELQTSHELMNSLPPVRLGQSKPFSSVVERPSSSYQIRAPLSTFKDLLRTSSPTLATTGHDTSVPPLHLDLRSMSYSNTSLSYFQVTLMLLDQSNREHIIDAFRPDVTSSSFQRPVSEMNIASGCPLFCPLSKLDAKNSYIRDDTIFIKAIVDLTGL
ncbi:TNF receptor-associated factor 2 [Nibea albiflora]|uniref:TNF receptor-associated factor 2 n=1 Tax=Nibea albiflora TaxID=240163 RepID=A0ACB7F829_NIBAL|nr:TNF receptor-associated factor 2 [Nibea albiflora]